MAKVDSLLVLFLVGREADDSDISSVLDSWNGLQHHVDIHRVSSPTSLVDKLSINRWDVVMIDGCLGLSGDGQLVEQIVAKAPQATFVRLPCDGVASQADPGSLGNLSPGKGSAWAASLQVVENVAKGYSSRAGAVSHHDEPPSLQRADSSRHARKFNMLADLIVELNHLGAADDPFRLLGERLREWLMTDSLFVLRLDKDVQSRAVFVPVGRPSDEDDLPTVPLSRLDPGLLDSFYSGHWFQMAPESVGMFLALTAPDTGEPERLNAEKSLGALGLVSDGRLIGALVVTEMTFEMSSNQVKLIETLAEQAAVSVERRLGEQRLRHSEERFRLLAERSVDAIFSLTLDGIVTYVSPSYQRIAGWVSEEVVGTDIKSRILDEDWEQFVGVGDRFRQGLAMTGIQIRVRRKDGGIATVEVNVAPVLENGKPVALQGIMRDVSDRLRMEEKMARMQRLEALGTLAGGVAHDFNNLLTAILGYADDLKANAGPDERVLRAATIISKAGNRASELTRKLLGFARVGKVTDTPVDLHSVIDDVADILRRTVDPRITIVKKRAPRSLFVAGDSSQLQQVVLNLGVNARDAMTDGGTLTFETRSIGRDDPLLPPGLDDEDAPSFACLSVHDTGAGIPDDIRERIFDPFFTTKAEGFGTGMGLAMVYRIVQSHRGTIDLESKPGEGSTFRVFLPATTAGRASATSSELLALRRGEGTVLVIDDEPVVRSSASDALEKLGYDVLLAENGEEGVSMFREHREQIVAVLLDMVMPKMNGVECFYAIRALDPSARVVVSSGFDRNNRSGALLDKGAKCFLPKPYTIRELAEALSSALGGDET